MAPIPIGAISGSILSATVSYLITERLFIPIKSTLQRPGAPNPGGITCSRCFCRAWPADRFYRRRLVGLCSFKRTLVGRFPECDDCSAGNHERAADQNGQRWQRSEGDEIDHLPDHK